MRRSGKGEGRQKDRGKGRERRALDGWWCVVATEVCLGLGSATRQSLEKEEEGWGLWGSWLNGMTVGVE